MVIWNPSLVIAKKTARFAVATSVFVVAATLIVSPVSVQGQDIGFERSLAKQMLETISGQVETNFYDPELRRLNWKELTLRTREQIEKANSPSDMRTAIDSLVNKLHDSHTAFIPPQRTIQRRFGFEAMAFGDAIRIYAVQKDGPAAAAGLQIGDRLLRINGVSVNRDSFDSMMLSLHTLVPVDALEVTSYREGAPSRIVRVHAQITEKAPLQYVTNTEGIYQVIHETESNTDHFFKAQRDKEVFDYRKSDDGIGYLHLPSFLADNTLLFRLVNKIAEATAVIVDLRGNPGGSIEAMQYLAGFFENQPKTIAAMVGRKGTKLVQVKPHHPYLSGPLFILIDSRTASAAEMFARHFQRTGRALVIGDRSAGRTSASRVFPNQIGSKMVISYGVQVAIARIIFPGGEDLEKMGVIPDVFCIPGPEDLRENRDVCQATAVTLARSFFGIGRR